MKFKIGILILVSVLGIFFFLENQKLKEWNEPAKEGCFSVSVMYKHVENENLEEIKQYVHSLFALDNESDNFYSYHQKWRNSGFFRLEFKQSELGKFLPDNIPALSDELLSLLNREKTNTEIKLCLVDDKQVLVVI